MADWQGVQQGLVSGFQVGQATGGKLSGIGMALNKVANRIRETRVQGEEMAQKQNLLGMEEASKIRITQAEEKAKGAREWKPTTMGEAIELEGIKNPPTSSEQFRNAIESSVAKIRAGGKASGETKDLMFKYPSSFNPTTHGYTLQQVEKESQKDLRVFRQQAIQELKKSKYPVTENNIKSAMEQLRG